MSGQGDGRTEERLNRRATTRRTVLQGLGTLGLVGTIGDAAAENSTVNRTQTQVGAGWPRPGRDTGNTRYAPNITGPETDIGVAYSAEFDVEEVWRNCAPVVSDGTVYITAGGQDQKLYAFDAEDGTREWTFEADVETEAPPAVVGDTAYLPASNRYVYAIDTATGTERWRQETSHSSDQQAAPVVADGSLYFTCKGGTYALDTTTGERQWSKTSRADPEISSYFAPALDGDLLFVSGTSNNETHGVFALSTADGSVRWTHETADGSWIDNNSQPVVANNTLYVGGNYDTESEGGGNLYALDPTTGSERWRYVSPSDDMISAPAVTGSTAVVYLGTDGIAAVDVTDGTEQWRAESRSGSWHTGLPTPAIAGDTVYVQAGGLHAFDVETGERRWEQQNLRLDIARPAVDSGRLYLGTTSQDASTTDEENVVIDSTTVLSARLYALESGGERIPEVTIDAPNEPSVGSQTAFTARLPDGFDPANWSFTWGVADGERVQAYDGQQITHQYTNTGDFDLAVGVTNSAGIGTSEWTQVTVSQSLETQSGERNKTTAVEQAGEGGVSVFERFGDDSTLPLALVGGGVLGGAGLGAYRWLTNDTDENRENR